MMSDISVFSNVIKLPKKQEYITMSQGNNLSFTETVQKKLEELVTLPKGWDGYKGLPVNLTNAYFALQMLETIRLEETPIPQIVPGVGGDLQIEWHTKICSIELHIIKPYHIIFWTDNVEIASEGILITSDFAIIHKAVSQLTDSLYDNATAA